MVYEGILKKKNEKLMYIGGCTIPLLLPKRGGVVWKGSILKILFHPLFEVT